MPKKTNFQSNGQNYFRVTATVGMSADGKRIRKQFYGESKKDAERKRDEYLQAINKGLDINFDKVLFIDLFYDWFFEVKKPSIADSSFNRYDALYRLHIKTALFANLPVISVKSIHIQKLYNTLKPAKIRMVNILLNSFFDYCVKEQMLSINPCKNVQRPKDDSVKEIKKFLNDEDIKVLNKAFEQDQSLFIFQFALATGMREGEILALTHNDIDDDIIHVTKSVNVIKVINKDSAQRKVIVRPCKNKASIRDLPISNAIKPNLEQHIKLEKEKHLKLGVPFSKDNLLFTSQCCTLVRANHLLARWKKVQRGLEIDPVSFHGLRHTFCSLLASNNVPLKTASVLMGHTNIEITAKIYTHVQDSQKVDAINKLDDILSKI